MHFIVSIMCITQNIYDSTHTIFNGRNLDPSLKQNDTTTMYFLWSSGYGGGCVWVGEVGGVKATLTFVSKFIFEAAVQTSI